MWQVEMVVMLRHMIDDLDDEPTYTDERLQELILVSAVQAVSEITFSTDYIIDIDGPSLTPDPTDRAANTRDDNFITLVCLKAACRLSKAELKKSGGQGIAIRDGDSAIDLRGNIVGRKESVLSFCQEYENARKAYQLGNRAVGTVIMGPFSLDNRYPYSPYRNRDWGV